MGTFNVMEVARQHKVEHLLMASTSSIYGANEDMPFAETDKADNQLTIYAATRKANEAMAHSYAHLWNLPTYDVPVFHRLWHLGAARSGLFQVHRCHPE